jgi:hypothetical protein
MDGFSTTALHFPFPLASGLQRCSTIRTRWTPFFRLFAPIRLPGGQSRFLQDLRFHSVHACVYRVFDFAKRRRGMGQPPILHATEHFFTQFSPSLFHGIIHDPLLQRFFLSYHLLFFLGIPLQKSDGHPPFHPGVRK